MKVENVRALADLDVFGSSAASTKPTEINGRVLVSCAFRYFYFPMFLPFNYERINQMNGPRKVRLIYIRLMPSFPVSILHETLHKQIIS